MKKLFISLAALCSMTAAWAADDDYTGSAGTASELTWTMPYEGGQMTISGDYMPMRTSYEGVDAIWNHDDVRPKITSILMKNGQTIGAHAFKNCENLTTFTYSPTSGNGLVKIGDYAFSQSAQLASIQLSGCNGLRYIGERAFAGTALKNFTINKPSVNPGGTILEDLGVNYDYCFVGANAFADCPYLTTVYMKDPVPFIDTYNGFLGGHAYLVVNDADAAAAYRTAWTEIANRIIYLAENITFENETFKDICISHWDTDGDGNLSYEEAFAVTTFGDAFKGNTELKEITLNDLMPFVNVTTYGSGVFEGCTSLEKITIPPYVTDIADDAFTGCTSLKEIHFVSKTPQLEDFTIVTNERTHIIVPDAYLPTYDAQWADKKDLIIGESHIAFQCPVTKEICVTHWDTDKDGELSYTEAKSVKTIRDEFYDSRITSFEELIFFTNLNYIDTNKDNYRYAGFGNCNLLTSIVIPASVIEIKDATFNYCKALKKIVFEDGNKTLKLGRAYYNAGNYFPLFSDCPLDYIYWGRNNVTCDLYFFELGQSITSFVVGKNITTLTHPFPTAKEVHISSLEQWLKISFSSSGNPVRSNGNLYLNGTLLKDITIPSTIKSIKAYSFDGCSLSSITIPEGVTNIEERAFRDCDNLTTITLPEGVTSIGNSAFSGCRNLTSITIPESVTSIGGGAFSNCRSLTALTIPESVTSIGSSAFSNIPTVIFESTTPSPETYNNFSSTATFIVPNDAVSTYRAAWSSVAHRITSKNALENWKEADCEAQPTSSHLAELIGEGNELDVVKLRIRGTINSYDMMVMRNKMQNLHELDLTHATIVTNTYNYGTGTSQDNVFPDFMKGKSLASLLLPKSITTIGDNALQGCINIKSITIPDNVTSLGSYAFSGCSTLSSVNVSASSKLQSIGQYAFQSTTNLKNIDFSQTSHLESIGNYAFSESYITSISLPTSLKTIGNYAFKDCQRLTSFASSANIGSFAFYGCSALNNVTILEGATSIDNYAFESCNALKTVIIEAGVTNIGSCAFRYCNALESITIEEGVTNIGNYAFQNCTALESISLPESLTSIGTYAFTGCSALKEISLPDALASLGTYAFRECTALQKAEIGMGIISVPQYLFYGCTALKEVKLSPKTTTIQSYAFQDCKGLTEFHLPPYLTTIQSNAFGGCSNLKEIYAYMPDVPTIAASTFSNYLTSTLYAPAFLFNAYYYDSGWNQFLYVKRCDLRPGDYEAFYTNKDLLFKEGEERITHDRPIVELGNQGAIIVEGANQEFTTVDMLRGTTSSSLIGDNNIIMDELRVKINVSANRWYFLCFPYDVEINECTYPGKYAWRHYDGATRAANGNGGWQKIEGTTLKAGVGYIFQSNTAGNVIVKFSDPEFGGDRPTTLTAYSSTNAANASWNFVGNPYASYYDFGSEEFASPITVWNGSTYVAYRPGDDDYHLQPYEAFFVQKTEDASAINFDAEGRETYRQSVATATAQARARRQRGIAPERLIVNLTISDNDTAAIDRTRLVMNAKASRSYEMACDASKFISDDAAAQLYTLEGTVKMAINERPGEGEVRLGYIAAKAGTLRLEAERMDMPMEIIDTKMDRIVDLSKGAYEFTTEAGTFDNRFVMRTSREATEIMTLTAATGVAIGMQEGGLSIGGADDKCISIYAANGALVAEHYGNGYVALASGTYVVKVDGHSAKMYVK